MSEQSSQEKTLDPSPRKLEQARSKGDVPISREGSTLGVYATALIGIGLAGNLITERIGITLVPLIEQPEAFLDLNLEGLEAAGRAVLGALTLALAPIFGLLVVGSLLPHFANNSIVVVGSRLGAKFSNLSPGKGMQRLFGLKALFEFGKSMVKAVTVAAAGWVIGKPLYDNSANLAALDPVAFLGMSREAIIVILFAVTLVAAVVAVVDVSFQRFEYTRRQRMSLQEMKEEMRSTDGDPHVKAQRRRIQRKRSQRRMLAEVPQATVVVTNPTHYAVALRYERGKDDAPICVAKGTDRVALRIRETAAAAGVPVMEDKPLARALYATAEIGEMIPRAHFEAVAKIIGLIWSRKAPEKQGAQS